MTVVAYSSSYFCMEPTQARRYMALGLLTCLIVTSFVVVRQVVISDPSTETGAMADYSSRTSYTDNKGGTHTGNYTSSGGGTTGGGGNGFSVTTQNSGGGGGTNKSGYEDNIAIPREVNSKATSSRASSTFNLDQINKQITVLTAQLNSLERQVEFYSHPNSGTTTASDGNAFDMISNFISNWKNNPTTPNAEKIAELNQQIAELSRKITQLQLQLENIVVDEGQTISNTSTQQFHVITPNRGTVYRHPYGGGVTIQWADPYDLDSVSIGYSKDGGPAVFIAKDIPSHQTTNVSEPFSGYRVNPPVSGDPTFVFPDIRTGQACTQEAKICPDGTGVGRTGPNCTFPACPEVQGAFDSIVENSASAIAINVVDQQSTIVHVPQTFSLKVGQTVSVDADSALNTSIKLDKIGIFPSMTGTPQASKIASLSVTQGGGCAPQPSGTELCMGMPTTLKHYDVPLSGVSSGGTYTISLNDLSSDVLKKINECTYSRGWYGASGNGLTIDWGDGSQSPVFTDDVKMGDSCTGEMKKHTYVKSGTYTVKVTSWHPGPTDAPITDWEGSLKAVVTSINEVGPTNIGAGLRITFVSASDRNDSGTFKITKNDTTPVPPPTACTREYIPVCGQPAMPLCPEGRMCSMMMPAPQTYSNMCTMKSAGATLVHAGACENNPTPTPIPPPISSERNTYSWKGVPLGSGYRIIIIGKKAGKMYFDTSDQEFTIAQMPVPFGGSWVWVPN